MIEAHYRGKWNVFTISDSSGEVFYVGMTKRKPEQILRTLIRTIVDYLKYPTIRHTYLLQRIKACDCNVAASTIEVVELDGDAVRKWGEIKKRWIQKYLKDGCSLCNQEVVGYSMGDDMPIKYTNGYFSLSHAGG